VRLFRGVWRCWPAFAASVVVLGPIYIAWGFFGATAACLVMLVQMALLFGFIFWEMGK
jgi:hypothetical protein